MTKSKVIVYANQKGEIAEKIITLKLGIGRAY